jgi:RNA polymerase sigma-70 factor, ECF subfamily
MKQTLLMAESQKEKLFQDILDENGSRLHVFAQSKTRGDHWKDLKQEIMLRIWKGLDDYEDRAKAGTWVYAIAYNTLKEFNRMLNRPETSLESLEMLPESQQCTYSTGESMDAIHMVESFIQSLGDDDRTALLMQTDGFTYKEISEAIGSDEGALRVRIHRLKKQLAKHVEG